MATERQSNIERRLVRAWSRERLYFGARGLFSFILVATLLLALDFILDWRLRLPGAVRIGLLVSNALVLLGVLYGMWWRSLKRFDALSVALQVEQLYPRLRSLLVSYVQLRDDSKIGTASPLLAAAMRQQAVTQVKQFDFRAIVRFRTLRRVFLLAFAVLACAIGLGRWQSELASVFLVRMISPGSAVTYPTKTSILSLGGDLAVQQGSTVMLRAMVAGEIPAHGVLTIRPEQGDAETVSVPAGEERGRARREFAYRVDEVYRSFSYAFEVGDDTSEQCRVQVIPPPVLEPRVELIYPAYTERRPKEIEMLSFEVLEGAKIVWRVTIDRSLTEAMMLMNDGPPAQMALSPDGKVATLTLDAEQSFSYGFQWKDRQHGFVYTPDVRYAVKVLSDRAPTVSMILPKQDEKATTQKALDMVFEASDDFGVTSASIVYTVQKGPAEVAATTEQRVPIYDFAETRSDVRESFVWDVQDAIPNLREGDVIVYALEVTDNRAGPNGPGAGRSATRRMSIISNEEYVRMAMARRRELLARIKALHAEEGRAVVAVRKLDEEDDSNPEGSE